MSNICPFALSFLVTPPLNVGATTLAGSFQHPDALLSEGCSLLLAPIYALRSQGIRTEYNALEARQSLMNFLNQNVSGVDPFLAGIREMARHVYGQACMRSGKTHFIDATFRNYYIIDELAQAFPEASFVQVRMNPLTYLSATIRQECDGKPDRLKLSDGRYRDLYGAYRHLSNAHERFGERFLAVEHEELKEQPARILAQVHHHLGLPPADSAIALAGMEGLQEHLDYWRESLYRERFAAIARDYLLHLGEDVISSQGYTQADLLERLATLGPDCRSCP
ncbi:MAG: hypothetical protein H6R10_1381 [Rhodocyclaceae bacterium]|nr:hypothetical protein [Rhodocyclaceae bacterium]